MSLPFQGSIYSNWQHYFAWIVIFPAPATIPLWISSQATNSYMIAGNLDQDSRRTQLKYWVWASSREDVELSWIVKDSLHA